MYYAPWHSSQSCSTKNAKTMKTKEELYDLFNAYSSDADWEKYDFVDPPYCSGALRRKEKKFKSSKPMFFIIMLAAYLDDLLARRN